jgi:hypothetical protein
MAGHVGILDLVRSEANNDHDARKKVVRMFMISFAGLVPDHNQAA